MTRTGRFALLALVVSLASCGSGEQEAAPPAPPDIVPTSFPTDQGRPFREPEEIRSEDGVIRADFTVARTRFEVGGTEVVGKSYDGEFIGPTLIVAPGDRIEIRLRNALDQQTNIHFHGFHTSPSGIADNVLRHIEPGQNARVVVPIPESMTPGSYWYHAHAHPESEAQVFGGLSGAIVVEGLVEDLPADLQGVTERLFAIKDLQVEDGVIPTHHINSDAPTTRTVNGLIDPRVEIAPGETQLWHLANIGADIWYRLELEGIPFHVIAEDANPVGEVWGARRLVLPPGKRYDVLVQGPEAGEYKLRTHDFSTGPEGDDYPARTLATIVSAGDSVEPAALPTSLGPLPHLEREEVDRRRHFVFSEKSKPDQFFINDEQFDHRVVNTSVELGATEEWVIENVSREMHPFHIHIDDFQVMSIGGEPYDAHGLQDIVPLPYEGKVVIRLRFTDFSGEFVYHCHILAHEDNGMMGTVEVARAGGEGVSGARGRSSAGRGR